MPLPQRHLDSRISSLRFQCAASAVKPSTLSMQELSVDAESREPEHLVQGPMPEKMDWSTAQALLLTATVL